jgi:hypothetical protein
MMSIKQVVRAGYAQLPQSRIAAHTHALGGGQLPTHEVLVWKYRCERVMVAAAASRAVPVRMNDQ